MLIGLKNSPDLIAHKTYGANIVKAFDFSVIEECVSAFSSADHALSPHPRRVRALALADTH
jgi:hypothetical protein